MLSRLYRRLVLLAFARLAERQTLPDSSSPEPFREAFYALADEAMCVYYD